MIARICQKVLDGFGAPVEWAINIVVPIFKVKVDVRNCSCYLAGNRLEHGMKVVKIVLVKASWNSDC